jgi:hypothetical protein
VRGKLVFGHVDDLHAQARAFGLFGGALLALTAHLVRVPTGG